MIVPPGQVQCSETIEKRFKGQRYVYSRTRCQRVVKDQGRPYEYCWQHQPRHLIRPARPERPERPEPPAKLLIP